MIKDIPTNPGCYLYKDDFQKIIYIGKAKNLKKRVASYFANKDLDEKTKILVKNIKDIDYIITNTEIEALILENNLIKKHQPKYNINLKDSKRYAYLQITDEEFPKLVIARKRTEKGKYFGPFTSAGEREYVKSRLIKLFRLRTCKKMPKRPCLRYHIHLCDAPCKKLVSKEEYKDKISKVEKVLKGGTKSIILDMKKEMKICRDKENFEKAINLREQIKSLEYLNEHQNMERSKIYDEDIINYVVEDKVYLMLFNIKNGILLNKQEFVFDYMDGFFEDFLVQLYDKNENKKEVILPIDVDDTLKKFLMTKKIKLIKAKKGERKQLLDLVKKNIETVFFGNLKKLESLGKDLKLNDVPEVIECFDISHLSGTATVGSMVQFRHGVPDKSNYRRFKIRTVEGIDDFKSINEVVYRRYLRLKKENADFPNLVIIDGGKGQLKAAIDALQSLDVSVPIISIAKKFEEIYVPGLKFPITLNEKSQSLLFIRQIRDEAHRFAIKYNRLLRSKVK